jgi:uncharacterized protein YdiU (UPF0061 family)
VRNYKGIHEKSLDLLPMTNPPKSSDNLDNAKRLNHFDDFAQSADYSFMNNLKADPDATDDGVDHSPRQVFSGHFVPVVPTPIPDPEYVSHSKSLFRDLGLSDGLVHNESFRKVFSGDLSRAVSPMKRFGWATGYALSIYGTEYTRQCPFQTGNGYGDGRAISIFEGIFNGQRWEMQLKGGGSTPYCRGADGRAVLRSSVREFLVQDFMHALGIPTSRSLTLYVSNSETVPRPWYSEGSNSVNPDIMTTNPVAIATRVAPSFLRVGQVELFSRRIRNKAHPGALEELRMIVGHLIKREYKAEIDQGQSFEKQIIELTKLFRGRLTRLIANWIRVGYCQGNFNSDNCAAGGFTLDYGPFGFCEIFDPEFQPWTGGGKHFSFFNQPNAAHANFEMFCTALRSLLEKSKELEEFERIRQGFSDTMQVELESVWASKLGLAAFHPETFKSLMRLMMLTKVDYTIFFRELSKVPPSISDLKKSFYNDVSTELESEWQSWLKQWRDQVLAANNLDPEVVSAKMKLVNPKYTWREWLVVPAYQQAANWDYTLVRELQKVLSHPYDEQSGEVEAKYYQLKPQEYFNAGGISQYSCSS